MYILWTRIQYNNLPLYIISHTRKSINVYPRKINGTSASVVYTRRTSKASLPQALYTCGTANKANPENRTMKTIAIALSTSTAAAFQQMHEMDREQRAERERGIHETIFDDCSYVYMMVDYIHLWRSRDSARERGEEEGIRNYSITAALDSARRGASPTRRRASRSKHILPVSPRVRHIYARRFPAPNAGRRHATTGIFGLTSRVRRRVFSFFPRDI